MEKTDQVKLKVQNSKLKTITQNFKFNKNYPFVILAVAILFLVVISLPRRRLGRLGNEIVPARKILEQKASPTRAPPTPTPTLTPEQIAEIKRKKFAEWNNKYGPCKYVPILMYHHVMDPVIAKAIGSSGLNVPPNVFREQVDYLLGKGYQIIGLDEMVSRIRNNLLPSKSVVLTFDDGYRDFYENVYPILREKNIKATVFVISQYLGGGRYLNWWQLKEMADSGLILVGDHTLNHPSLPSLSKEEEANQIVSAKKIIEENIGRSVEFFAYPYGGTNAIAKEILKENGFLGAVVTTNASPQCLGLPYEFSRIRIGATSLSRYGL